MVVCPCPTIGKVASGMRAVPPERLDSSTATAAGGANQAEQPAPDAAVNVSRSDTNMRDDASGGPRRPARRADSTDAVASFLSRRFGLAGGLAWLGVLAVGSLGEQVKTRLEVAAERDATRDVAGEEVSLPSGVVYRDERIGGGAPPQRGYLVVLDYM
jgi:hypothetical protein